MTPPPTTIHYPQIETLCKRAFSTRVNTFKYTIYKYKEVSDLRPNSTKSPQLSCITGSLRSVRGGPEAPPPPPPPPQPHWSLTRSLQSLRGGSPGPRHYWGLQRSPPP